MNQRTLVICGTAALGTGIVIGGGILIMKLVRRAARCCRDEGNPYEADQMVDEYMGFHYAPPPDYISYPFAPKDSFEFPVRCAELCKKHRNEELLSRALDIGCAVGRSTFELATDFHQVIGIDYSNAFIKKANTLAQMGRSTYKIKVEGDLTVELEANVDPNIDRTRVIFEVGDACALRKDLGQFGMVLAANLICRLPDPKLFLHRLNELVLPGGIVVITSPYTWLDDYTPKVNSDLIL
jgi:putative 4-mercaptohistidine N1-methyltranferase